MKKVNKSKYAILGLLSFGPKSGYDIKNYYDKSIGFFWHENYGKIYPLLKKLDEDGEVTKEVLPQKGKPDKNVYSITEKGLKSLKGWLSEDEFSPKLSEELLLKTFFGSITDIKFTLDRLEKSMEESYSRLKMFEELEKNMIKSIDSDPTIPFRLATLRMGKRISKSKAVWAKETIADLKSSFKSEL